MGKKIDSNDINKKRQDRNEKPKRKTISNKILIGIVIAAVAVSITVITITYKPSINTTSMTTGTSPIDGIECGKQEFLVFHVHAHLDVFVNGQQLTVPAFIGIRDNTCLYWLHTHTTDGVIHIESPEPRAFTLGEFLDIWDATNNGFPPKDQEPKIYQNGQVVNASSKDLALNPHDEYVLVYGSPPTSIPSSYQFAQGQ